MKVTLNDGYEVTIKEEGFNNWNTLRMLRGIDKGETALIVDVVDAILGEEQSQALETHLAVDGVTSIDSMVNAITEIMDQASALKNS